jgi:hypothetical protein
MLVEMAQLNQTVPDTVRSSIFSNTHLLINFILVALLSGFVGYSFGIRHCQNTTSSQIALSVPRPTRSSEVAAVLSKVSPTTPAPTFAQLGSAQASYPKSPATIPNIVIPTVTAFATPTPDAIMADWKTSKDSMSGFAFKYPGHWVYNGVHDQGYSPYPTDVSIEGKMRIVSFSVPDINNQNIGYLLIVTVDDNIENMPLVYRLGNHSEQTIVAGYPAIKQPAPPDDSYVFNAPGLQKQNATYIFNFKPDFKGAEDQPSEKTDLWVQQETANFDRVISSFKILQ